MSYAAYVFGGWVLGLLLAEGIVAVLLALLVPDAGAGPAMVLGILVGFVVSLGGAVAGIALYDHDHPLDL